MGRRRTSVVDKKATIASFNPTRRKQSFVHLRPMSASGPLAGFLVVVVQTKIKTFCR